MKGPLSPQIAIILILLVTGTVLLLRVPASWENLARPAAVDNTLPQIPWSMAEKPLAPLASPAQPAQSLELVAKPATDTKPLLRPLAADWNDANSGDLKPIAEEAMPAANGLLASAASATAQTDDNTITDAAPPALSWARPVLRSKPDLEDEWLWVDGAELIPAPPPAPLAIDDALPILNAKPSRGTNRLIAGGPFLTGMPTGDGNASRIVPRTWVHPASLVERLKGLRQPRDYANWAQAVSKSIDGLAQRPGHAEAARLFEELRFLLAESTQLDTASHTEVDRVQLRLTAYALLRWLDVQQSAAEMLDRGTTLQVAAGTADAAGHGITRADIPDLLSRLEHFEQSGASESSERVANAARRMLASDDPAAQAFARRIGQHYRNLNVRLTLSPEFLKRVLPQPEDEDGRVAEWIDGHLVYGRSTTSTQVDLDLEPHEHAWHLVFSAEGTVSSRTRMSAGAATFSSANRSWFEAQVPIVLSHTGAQAGEPRVRVSSASRLNDVATNFDNVPLIGAMARGYAEYRHEQRQSETRSEIDRRVAQRVRTTIGEQIETKMAESRERVSGQLLGPLETLGLDVGPTALATTDTELVLRTRLAAGDQLAAFTPRPRAPDTCWASLQMHESAANNLVDRLELAGKHFTLPDLSRYLADKSGRPLQAVPTDLPSNVAVAFSSVDPVRVFCRDDQLEICLRLDRLEVGEHTAQDVHIRVFYKPEVTAGEAYLVRDGGLQLASSDGTRSRFMVRSVLAKVFAANRAWPIATAAQLDAMNLADVGIVQAELRDGWVALALAPVENRAIAAPPQETLVFDEPLEIEDEEHFEPLGSDDLLEGLTPLD